MGFFSLFRKTKDNDELKKQTIYIYDDNYEKVEMDKDFWLSTKFYPIVDDENETSQHKCDLIDLALEAGIKEEVIAPAAKLYAQNPKSLNILTLLFKTYMKNDMYQEAIELYEDYENEGNKLKWQMYYEKSIAHEKLNQVKDQEKCLLNAFEGNNNHIDTIDKFVDLMSKINPNGLDEWMENLCKNSKSWYLYKKLAILKASKGYNTDACESILKCIELSQADEKILLELGDILKNINKYDEYYNYIVSQYDPETSSIEFTNKVLEFYLLDNNPKKGLELLKKLYNSDRYDEIFYNYERKYNQKLIDLEHKKVGKINVLNIQGPLYRKIFYIENEVRDSKSLLILHFTVDPKIENLTPKVCDFARNIGTYLNDELFLNTNLNVKNMLLTNNLGLCIYTQQYTDEYLQYLAIQNQSIDYIMYGVISDIDKNDNFYLKVYLYKSKENEKIELFNTTISNDIQNSIRKLLINSLQMNLNISVNQLNVYDNDFIYYLSSYTDLIFNRLNDRNNRLYEIDKVIKYLLNNTNLYKFNMCLSLIHLLSASMPDIKLKYKKDLALVTKSMIFDEQTLQNMNKVFGENNE